MSAATAASAPPDPATPVTRNLTSRRVAGLAVILVGLAVASVLSIMVGANTLSPAQVWRGWWAHDDSQASTIVWTLRGPRTVVGLAVGAAFGLAGALIQALTRNPLADPGILGVNAGAGFAITIGTGAFGFAGVSGYIWFAFLGAGIATVLVYLIGSAGGGTANPVSLVLAGVALSAVLGGISTFLMLINPETFTEVRSWGLGSIARTSLSDTATVGVFLLVGAVLALGLSGSLNSVALGDDLAASLGTSVTRVRVLGIIAVTLLAGGGTALTGGIAFLGLMIPHVVRWFVGPDQRWILAYSALAAPTVMLFADVLGRVLGGASEIEAGVMTAVIGAPVLIVLVRRRKASGL